MIKFLYLIVVLAVSLVAISAEPNDQTPIKKIVSSIDKVTDRGAQAIHDSVHEAGDKIERGADKFVNPPAHEPGKHNIVSSAIRGASRLLRNVTVSTARFGKNLVKDTKQFRSNLTTAVSTTAKEVVNRIKNGRQRSDTNDDGALRIQGSDTGAKDGPTDSEKVENEEPVNESVSESSEPVTETAKNEVSNEAAEAVDPNPEVTEKAKEE